MLKLHFDLVGGNCEGWVWRLVDDAGATVSRSTRPFDHYLDALADARKSGLRQEPVLRVRCYGTALRQGEETTSLPA